MATNGASASVHGGQGSAHATVSPDGTSMVDATEVGNGQGGNEPDAQANATPAGQRSDLSITNSWGGAQQP